MDRSTLLAIVARIAALQALVFVGGIAVLWLTLAVAYELEFRTRLYDNDWPVAFLITVIALNALLLPAIVWLGVQRGAWREWIGMATMARKLADDSAEANRTAQQKRPRADA